MATASKDPIYFKSFLKRRIEMLMQHGKLRARPWIAACLGTASVVITLLSAYASEVSLRNTDDGRVNPGIVVVDPNIQNIADRALSDAIREEQASDAFAIVAEPSTGRILAVANIDTKNPRNGHWALAQTFEPASIAKTLVAAKAIDEGKTTRLEEHKCESGSYKYGDHVYHDWKGEGWEHLTTQDTIAYSSDICAIKIGETLGAEGLREMLPDFGFGPVGSAKSFPEARPGELPLRGSNSSRLVPYVSMGYGFQISPLEMVQAYGAIANGGNLLAPQPANSTKTEIVRRVLSEDAARETREILRQVVLKGTGKAHAKSDLYTTAGKTASSYTEDLLALDWLGGNKQSNLAGFIGFAPLENPKVEVFVIVRNPGSRDGAHGATHAAPIFKRIVEETLKFMGVPPDINGNS
jgi:cell division protein FtsI/penicillin-binding protein 2